VNTVAEFGELTLLDLRLAARAAQYSQYAFQAGFKQAVEKGVIIEMQAPGPGNRKIISLPEEQEEME